MATLQRPGTEITPAERAAIGAETARLEGRGPAGEAMEAAKNVATGRDDLPRSALEGISSSSSSNGAGPHHNGAGLLGRTEEELSHLRLRTQITHEGEAYCPNPNIKDLVRHEFGRAQFVIFVIRANRRAPQPLHYGDFSST